jgi:arginine exporter protein ArgO
MGGKKMEALVHGIILAFGLIIPLGVRNIFNQGATHKSYVCISSCYNGWYL